MITAWRMQDDKGRGPWRPGFSKYWRDSCDDRITETVMDLVGGIENMRNLPRGFYYGCACKSKEQLLSWFSDDERRILESVGFKIITVSVDRVVADGEHQMLVASRVPFNQCIVEVDCVA